MKHIEEIYENLIVELKYMYKVDTAAEKVLREVIRKMKDSDIELNQCEEIRDEIYGALECAKRKSFEIGFCYAVSLIIESLSDSRIRESE